MSASSRALSVLAALVFAVYAAISLHYHVSEAIFPLARGWVSPVGLAWGAILLGACVGGLLRRDATGAAFALAGVALAVAGMRDVPDYHAANHAGDGPAVGWVLWLVGAVGAAWALWPGGRWSRAERHGALLVLWTTANLRLYARDSQTIYGMFALACMVHLCAYGGVSLRSLLGGLRRGWIPLGLCAWWLAATLQGDSLRVGLDFWVRLFTGGLLAWSLAASARPGGELRPARGLLVGFAVGLLALVLVNLEMRPWVEPTRHLRWRLRLFGLHPNQIAPFFAAGAAVGIALALGAKQLLLRLGALLIGVGCLLALAWTRSRSGWLGFALAAPVVVLALRARLPRRAGLWWAALSALVLLGVGALVSPVGAGVRARLDASAQGPSAVGQRWHFWKMAAGTLREDPVWGAGPGQFYAHARFAEPSYYDGTTQDLHAHNLVLAMGESAGLPGMLLGLLFLLGALELARQRVLGSEGAERAWSAAVGGGLLAILGASLLDLGQSQNTLLPLWAWVAWGVLLEARARPQGESEEARGSGPVLALLGVGLVVALGLRPMVSEVLVARGRDALFAGEPQRAEQSYQLARRLDPLSDRPLQALVGLYRKERQQAQVRALLSELADGVPSRSRTRLTFARELLRQKRPDAALVELERALALDPRGPVVDDVAYFRAWAHLLRGEELEARAALEEGVRNPGGSWRDLPQFEAPPREGDPPGARRVHFDLGGGRGIPLSEILEAVGRESAERVGEDPVTARRMLGAVLEGYRSQGLGEEAAQCMERFRAAAGAAVLPSLVVLELEALVEKGALQEALALYERSEGRGDPHHVAPLVHGLLEQPTPENLVRARELVNEADNSPFTTRFKDLFFTSGTHKSAYQARARLALHEGDTERALRELRWAVFDGGEPHERAEIVHQFLADQLHVRFDAERYFETLDFLLEIASSNKLLSRNVQRMREWARVTLELWPGTPAELDESLAPILRASGGAGETFAQMLLAQRGAGAGGGRRRRR